jgi:hypothetical protein
MDLATGLVLAVAASLAVNRSYLVQHAGLASAPAVRATAPLRTVAGLLGSPAWRRGAALGYAGLALEAAALVFAPLSLVQSVLAGGLVIVAAAARRERAGAVGAAPIALAVAGATMLALGQSAAGRHAAALPALLGFLAALAIASAAIVLTERAGARGLAAGLLYGGTTVVIADLAAALGAGTLGRPQTGVVLGAGAAVTAAGFLLFQRALQDEAPAPAVTAMTAGTNAAAIAGAILIFAEPLGRTPVLAALHAAGLLALVLAAALAARRFTDRRAPCART